MDDLKRLLIERECERLTVQFCHFVDFGEAARVADLFAEDGVCTLGTPMTGREAIRATFERRQALANRRSMHVCCNQLINVIDEDHAEGAVYLTHYLHDGDGAPTAPSAPPSVGAYRDTFVRTPEGWRFKTRTVVVTFVAA
jgi:hypothetical protein